MLFYYHKARVLSGASIFLEADGLWGCYHYLSYLNEPTAHWFRSQWDLTDLE